MMGTGDCQLTYTELSERIGMDGFLDLMDARLTILKNERNAREAEEAKSKRNARRF